MKRTLIVAAAALVAIPAIAQMASTTADTKHDMKPQTRADVASRVQDRLGKMDADRNGTVSRTEMIAFAQTRMKARGDEMFAALDADKNGSISRAEFDAHHGDMSHHRTLGMDHRGMGDGAKREGAARMMMHDRMGMMMAEGGDGIVIADAVKKALARFDAADTNKDGTLSPEERKAARETMRDRWKARGA